MQIINFYPKNRRVSEHARERLVITLKLLHNLFLSKTQLLKFQEV